MIFIQPINKTQVGTEGETDAISFSDIDTFYTSGELPS